MFTAGSGSEEDPFIINDEVPQWSPCSSCMKESYVGPMQTGQCCSLHGQRPGSLLSEDSTALQRRFEIQRRQTTPNEGSLMGGTSYRKFDSQRAANKQRARAIDYIDDLPLFLPGEDSLRMENKVPIPILPPITSSSRGEGSLSSRVPLDSIPQDLGSHHKFVKEWASKLTLGKTL